MSFRTQRTLKELDEIKKELENQKSPDLQVSIWSVLEEINTELKSLGPIQGKIDSLIEGRKEIAVLNTKFEKIIEHQFDSISESQQNITELHNKFEAVGISDEKIVAMQKGIQDLLIVTTQQNQEILELKETVSQLEKMFLSLGRHFRHQGEIFTSSIEVDMESEEPT
jgi:flagellar hook-basal body complex protein FliE